MRKSIKISLGVLATVSFTGIGFLFLAWPTSRAQASYIHFRKDVPLSQALDEAQARGYIRSSAAVGLFARLVGAPDKVDAGTYQLRGKRPDRFLWSLRHPVRWNIHLPGNFWIERMATYLEKKEVCSAQDFNQAAKQIAEKGEYKGLPLPTESLDGYLLPGDYELGPETPADEVITKQLDDFIDQVWVPMGKPKDIHRLLTVASMIQLEAKEDSDRPLIASVIYNRLQKGMPLQIDATVLYAQKRWGRLMFKDIRETVSPYNTYKNKGLPPGPICSPNLLSIEAAKNPANTKFLYYVALPNGYHLFSDNYADHLKNIEKRKDAVARDLAESL